MPAFSAETWILIGLSALIGVGGMLYVVASAIRDEARLREARQRAIAMRESWSRGRKAAEDAAVIEVDEAPSSESKAA